MKKILVTGGAGYIGSHTCKVLSQKGITPIVLDSLVYGHQDFVKWGPFYQGQISDKELLKKVFTEHQIDGVIHFAAYAYVGESVKDPAKYYDNNVVGSLRLIESCRDNGIDKIVFSSTCATYGIPNVVPISETNAQNPINPYGQSKLMVEKILADFSAAYRMKTAALRYFNAAGADLDGEIGEDHNPETHLIPLAIQAAYNDDKPLTIFGADYATPDGTCIRDYIHVLDLAEAHVLALNYLAKSDAGIFLASNVGTGKGFSVLEIISSVEKISGRKVKSIWGARRPGDPPVLVANDHFARTELGWDKKFSDIDTIIKSAHDWQVKRQRL